MTNAHLPIHFEPRISTSKIKKAKYFSLLFKKYRDRFDYYKVPESLRIAYSDSLLTKDGKLFYVKNSKAGCTSISQILYKYSKGNFFDKDIHKENTTLKQYQHHWRSFEDALNGEALAFTFVRHPESRLISAFRDFFVEKKNRSHDKHLPAMESRGFSESNSLSRNFCIFLDYIEESLGIDPLYTDRHWRPQHINVAANDIRYGFIGKLENFDQDIRTVFDLIGKSNFIARSHMGARFNVSKGKTITLTVEERNRIERIYEKDYSTFGY